WLTVVAVWPALRKHRTRPTPSALFALVLAIILVVPQLALYSAQGVMEGRYELPAAIGLALLTLFGVQRLRDLRRPVAYRFAVVAWSSMLALFALSTWSYAARFTADSLELDRMLSAVTETAPPGTVVAIVADPGRQFE